jgi:hypothetical protein
LIWFSFNANAAVAEISRNILPHDQLILASQGAQFGQSPLPVSKSRDDGEKRAVHEIAAKITPQKHSSLIAGVAQTISNTVQFRGG